MQVCIEFSSILTVAMVLLQEVGNDCQYRIILPHVAAIREGLITGIKNMLHSCSRLVREVAFWGHGNFPSVKIGRSW